MKVSNCCGDPGTKIYSGEVLYNDLDLCGECGEHCEYVEESNFDDFDINIPPPKKSFKVKAKIISIKHGLT